MSFEVMSLGWCVRFAPASLLAPMSEYFLKTLGLPRTGGLRIARGDPENKNLMWGGETIIVNHNFGGVEAPVSPREAAPETARYAPIYRVSGLDGLVERLRQRGAVVRDPRPCAYGREAFILDPMGMLTGLRERDAGSPLAQDHEAARRRRRGEAFNPGCQSMPERWQELGWIRLTAEDLPGLTRFYRDTVGFTVLGEVGGCVLFDFGDNTTLELAPGGAGRAPPEIQMAAQAAPILRVPDVHGAIAHLRSGGVHFVHDLLTSPKSEFAYFADPEGNVTGICQTFHPSRYCENHTVLAEDVESERRWVELKAARQGCAVPAAVLSARPSPVAERGSALPRP
jgi:predicted enzyme related to lactoylglutathione lyase